MFNQNHFPAYNQLGFCSAGAAASPFGFKATTSAQPASVTPPKGPNFAVYDDSKATMADSLSFIGSYFSSIAQSLQGLFDDGEPDAESAFDRETIQEYQQRSNSDLLSECIPSRLFTKDFWDGEAPQV